jgi:alpha-glucosidase
MRLKITILAFLIPLLISAQGKIKQYSVKSPDNKLVFRLNVSDKLEISAGYKGKKLLDPSEIAMKLSSGVLGKNPKVRKVKTARISQELHPVVREKQAVIKNECNELRVDLKGNYYVILRAYNDGFAYRFGTTLPGEITVVSETGKYRFPEDHNFWWSREKKFYSSNQVTYAYKSLKEFTPDQLASLPMIIDSANDGPKLVITETDLQDYPGMWLRGDNLSGFHRVSPQYPKKFSHKNDRYHPIEERENYIAKTSGTRTFPWRIFAVAEKDADLITNQLSYILAAPQKIKETSWIKPGKVAWDWWNANNIYGVDFRAGINTETYKYYIDFASKYGLEYVVLDEGWYVLGDIMNIVPEIDMQEILSYAKQKNVGIVLWCVWKTLDDKVDPAMDQFEKWGVKGIKVDFMDRDDQQMVNYYHKIARKAAEHHLLVDFHGAYKPSGLRRMYPNVITREAVNGAEEFKWSIHQTPEHDLILPFGRMLAGPMDYTPGAMHNAQKKDYKPIFNTPMSMGTRCHQLAMYVVYESPLQMLCDSPSNYYREPEAMEFLSVVPTVWDETLVLEAKVSDYILLARKNGKNWYVGGMTDWDARDLKVDLSFLPKGKQYKMTLYQDGINADRIAIDFKQIKSTVDSSYQETIHLAPGGGVVMVLEPVN